MKPFNLSEWLEDKSRKVVTRRENPVRIICTDRKHGEDDLPIVFLEENNGGEFLLTCRNDGRCDNYDTQYDLFFADEEEKLTEFEKALSEIIGFWQRNNGSVLKTQSQLKSDAKALLDLAKKEFKKEFKDEEYFRLITEHYKQGKKEALKDLPKWKKATEKKDLEKHIAILEENKVLLSNYLEKGDYYIVLDDLKILPKEE